MSHETLNPIKKDTHTKKKIRKKNNIFGFIFSSPLRLEPDVVHTRFAQNTLFLSLDAKEARGRFWETEIIAREREGLSLSLLLSFFNTNNTCVRREREREREAKMKSMSRRERKELLKRWNASSHETTARVLREKKKKNTTTTTDDFFDDDDGLEAEKEHKKRFGGWSFSRKENWIGMPDFDERRRRKGGNEDETRYAIRPSSSSSSTPGSDQKTHHHQRRRKKSREREDEDKGLPLSKETLTTSSPQNSAVEKKRGTKEASAGAALVEDGDWRRRSRDVWLSGTSVSSVRCVDPTKGVERSTTLEEDEDTKKKMMKADDEGKHLDEDGRPYPPTGGHREEERRTTPPKKIVDEKKKKKKKKK